jgi:hypothetical protein
VNDETKEQSKQWMHTQSRNNPKNIKQTLSACHKADGSRFLGKERSADGGIHATVDQNNIRSVWRNTKKKMHRSIQNKMRGMLTYGAGLLHDSDRSHTAARTRSLLGHCTWELLSNLLTALISL